MMSVEVDNLKALVNSLDGKDEPSIEYKYSPVDPCGIIGVSVYFNKTIYLTRREHEQVSKPK